MAAPTTNSEIDLDRLGRRVLIVDDNETNRRVLAGQLMHAGYDVSLASSGLEALGLLHRAAADDLPFEVVLADYRMQDMDGGALGERINTDPTISSARVVMLTSVDRHGDIAKYAALGFAAYLTKPIRTRELLDCLDRVLRCDAKQWHLQSQPIITRGMLSAAGTHRYDGTILLVEDNPVNQKVALRFLERMGFKVRIADNGLEGVKAFADGHFDIVLMDLQMPVMDGLTATRRIRELETGRRTPIVALTANAMAGQLERCTEAGMDGFLTKPLELVRLREVLDRYGLAMNTQDSPQTPASEESVPAPVDLARLNELTDGDPEFTQELTATFIASGEQVMAEIQAALEAFDRTALSRAAHKLKGASANIHANRLRDVSFELESRVAQMDQGQVKALLATLQEEFKRAGEFLQSQTSAGVSKAG